MVAVAVLLMITLLSGCGSKDASTKKVRIGYFPNVTHAPALVGFGEQRFAKEFGEEVVLEEKLFVAGPALMEALIAGEVDLGYIGPIPAINGYVQGSTISVLAGVNNGGAVLVAGKNSGITTPADLRGKKVAVPQFANTQDISLRHILKEYKLDDSTKGGTVEIVQVSPSDMGILFSRDQIDAALVPEPWGTQLVTDFEAKIVLDWNEIWNKGDYPTTIIIARNDFIDSNPEFVERWLKVHGEIINYIEAEPDKARQVIGKQIEKVAGKALPEDQLVNSMAKCKVTKELDPEVMKEFALLSYEAGYLKTNPDLSALLSYLPKVK